MGILFKGTKASIKTWLFRVFQRYMSKLIYVFPKQNLKKTNLTLFRRNNAKKMKKLNRAPLERKYFSANELVNTSRNGDLFDRLKQNSLPHIRYKKWVVKFELAYTRRQRRLRRRQKKGTAKIHNFLLSFDRFFHDIVIKLKWEFSPSSSSSRKMQILSLPVTNRRPTATYHAFLKTSTKISISNAIEFSVVVYV